MCNKSSLISFCRLQFFVVVLHKIVPGRPYQLCSFFAPTVVVVMVVLSSSARALKLVITEMMETLFSKNQKQKMTSLLFFLSSCASRVF